MDNYISFPCEQCEHLRIVLQWIIVFACPQCEYLRTGSIYPPSLASSMTFYENLELHWIIIMDVFYVLQWIIKRYNNIPSNLRIVS